MSEETTEPIFEPAVFAVEQYRHENAQRRHLVFGVVGGVLCVALGAGGVFFALSYSGQLRQASSQVALVPLVKKEGANIATYGSDRTDGAYATHSFFPFDFIESLKEPADVKPGEVKTPPANTGPKQSSTMPPLDPFNGGPVPKDWAKGQIGPPDQGSIGIKPEGGPEATNPDKPETPVAAGNAVLITARAGSGDAEGDAEQIVRALQGAGASVRTAHHLSPSGGVTGVQIVASLTADSLASAKSRLASAGVSLGDDWAGSVASRSSRVSSILSSRISTLRKARTDLLVKFLEDAPEVTQVDEEIQKLNQCLGMVRSSGKSPKIAIIVIGVGGL